MVLQSLVMRRMAFTSMAVEMNDHRGIGMGNVILGNRNIGILIDGTSNGTVIQGNSIGVNVAGTVIHGKRSKRDPPSE